MDFVLVFPLILAFLSTAVTQQKWNSSCTTLCPAGKYLNGDCVCEICGRNKYTAKENSLHKCLRCDSCGYYEVEIKPCTFNSNVVCDCKADYYNRNSSSSSMDCQPCSSECSGDLNKYPDYKRKCQPCQRCLKFGRKRICTTDFTPSPKSSMAGTTSPSPSTARQSTASNTPLHPMMNPIPDPSNPMSWLFLLVFLVTVVVIYLVCLLQPLILSRNWFRCPVTYPCRSEDKDLEQPVELARFNEQSSLQGHSPGTMTSTTSEETPIITSQSPETPGLHISPADDEHKAPRQDEPSEHWPAIILYAIIKEVPLRRWKEFLRLLSVADQQLERVELEAGLGLGSMERQYQMLRLWSQRTTASMDDVFSALHYMDLSGCAQLLQESLERLQGRPELKQDSTACRGYTYHGFNGTMQDT